MTSCLYPTAKKSARSCGRWKLWRPWVQLPEPASLSVERDSNFRRQELEMDMEFSEHDSTNNGNGQPSHGSLPRSTKPEDPRKVRHIAAPWFRRRAFLI